VKGWENTGVNFLGTGRKNRMRKIETRDSIRKAVGERKAHIMKELRGNS